jgi:hypothetical protein
MRERRERGNGNRETGKKKKKETAREEEGRELRIGK